MHHISDVDTWGNPDRNYYIFVVLTLVFGFIGLDHFYLRSFGTAFQKILVNVMTLGFWYWWDVIQVMTDGRKVREEGLTSPLDWIRGIGRGVFRKLPTKEDLAGGSLARSNPEPEYEAKKSYLIYALLTVCLGFLGADKFYVGESWQGAAKLFSCFNIFIFMFGWLWVAWDAFHAVFMTKSILKDGITTPMPYSFVFTQPVDPEIFKVRESVVETLPVSTPTGFLDWIARTFGFPSVPQGLPLRDIYKELVGPLMTPSLVKEVRGLREDLARPIPPLSIPTPTDMLDAAKSLVPEPVAAAANLLASPPKQPEMFAAAANLLASPPKQPEMFTAASNLLSSTLEQPKPMRGGGVESGGPGPVVAGVLTAVVMAGGLKGFYDFVIKQYG